MSRSRRLVVATEFEVAKTQGLCIRSQYSSSKDSIDTIDVTGALDSFPRVPLKAGDVWVLYVFHEHIHQENKVGMKVTFFTETYKWERLFATEHAEEAGRITDNLLYKFRCNK